MVLSAGCMVTTNFHDRLIISTLGPLVALGALELSFQVAAGRNHGSQEALQTVRWKHFSMVLLVTFLIYSSVSSTVFRMFACETLDGGKEYLRADYTIQCTFAKHKALQVGCVGIRRLGRLPGEWPLALIVWALSFMVLYAVRSDVLIGYTPGSVVGTMLQCCDVAGTANYRNFPGALD